CAASVSHFDPGQPYLWPDSADAAAGPFDYVKVDNVTVIPTDPDGAPIAGAQSTVSLILVQIVADPSSPLQPAASLTYGLFRLNGRYFNEDFQQPSYTLPYAEYLHPSD